jgi:hypothetical protein
MGAGVDGAAGFAGHVNRRGQPLGLPFPPAALAFGGGGVVRHLEASGLSASAFPAW